MSNSSINNKSEKCANLTAKDKKKKHEGKRTYINSSRLKKPIARNASFTVEGFSYPWTFIPSQKLNFNKNNILILTKLNFKTI